MISKRSFFDFHSNLFSYSGYLYPMPRYLQSANTVIRFAF